jgi:uncharacterized protein YegL
MQTARRFGDGVSVSAAPDRQDVTMLRLVADDLGALAAGPSLVIVQGSDGEILAERIIGRFEGTLVAELDVPPDVAREDGTVIVLARRTEAGTELSTTPTTPFASPIDGGNREPRCACVLVIDMAAPMSTGAVDEINRGLEAFTRALKAHPVPRDRAELAVINCGEGEAPTVAIPFSEVDALAPHLLEASGGAHLAAGILLALHEITERERDYASIGVDHVTPQLVLITGGAPADDASVITDALRELATWEEGGRVSVLPVGVGDCVDFDFLTLTSKARAPLHINEAQVAGFFDRAATEIVGLASAGTERTTDLEENQRCATADQPPSTYPPADRR